MEKQTNLTIVTGDCITFSLVIDRKGGGGEITENLED